uniref:Uncharacterized protein n=1 Tax=Attheya septentrionalis TaxID=420275 RepID=A0A7S2XSL7_9STRA
MPSCDGGGTSTTTTRIQVHRTDLWRPMELQNYVPRLHPSYQENGQLANQRDVFYVAERTRLGCAVMDSGPHDMDFSNRWHMARRVLFPTSSSSTNKSSNANLFWCWMMQLSLILHHLWHCLSQTLGAKQDHHNNNNNNHTNTTTKNIMTCVSEKPLVLLTNSVAYVYSTNDVVCPYKTVETAMRLQRSHGSQVTELKLDESGHLQHYQQHDWQYERFVRNLLQEFAPVNYEDEEGEA